MFNLKSKSYGEAFSSFVTGNTIQSDALKEPTVLTAISLIANAISCLPIYCYKSGKLDERSMQSQIVKKPNNYQTMPELLGQVGTHLALYRQSALIIKKTGNSVVSIECLDTPMQVSSIKVNGTIKYSGSDNFGRSVNSDEVYLISMPSMRTAERFDILKNAKSSIELSTQAIKSATDYYSKGPRAGAFITVDTKLTDDQYSRMDKRMNDQSGSENAHKLMVLENGAKFQPNTTSLKDSEINASRSSSVREIASLMGIPLPLVGIPDPTYKSISEIRQAFHDQTIGPMLHIIESKINSAFPANTDLRFDTTGFLRSDPKTAAEVSQMLLTRGIISLNEARIRCDEEPIHGEELFVIDSNNLSFGTIEDFKKQKQEPEGKIQDEQITQPETP